MRGGVLDAAGATKRLMRRCPSEWQARSRWDDLHVRCNNSARHDCRWSACASCAHSFSHVMRGCTHGGSWPRSISRGRTGGPGNSTKVLGWSAV
eukprot:scaffold100050_cov72-Phaeocystis_antarctica.AAC.3